MAQQGNGSLAALNELRTPARNHYFYGKLLDVFHFQMEQTYFNRKRWLLNRLGLGSGVLCGLEVILADDGQQVGIQPGVAIDPLGRELIVPEPCCITNPRQLTDACGRPLGEPLAGAGVVTLCLAYHECEAEPAPVLVGDCDTRGACAPSTIRERYKLLLQQGAPPNPPGLITDEQCQAIFPHGEVEPNFDHRQAACTELSGQCPTPQDDCVVLATITLPAEATESLVIDACTYRTNVYSNTMLFDLLLCLAARVDDCCHTLILRYVSGDAQQAAPGQPLAAPLVVEVINGDGTPVAAETVTFRVRGGGGVLLSLDQVATDSNGRAEVQWQLGPNAGLNTLEAGIASGAQVVFFAMGVSEDNGETPTPPVVMALWPPNATHLPTNNDEWNALWQEQPRLALTFDRAMNQTQLDQPAAREWLRIFQVRNLGRNRINVRPIDFKLMEISDGFQGAQGFSAVYALGAEPNEQARYLVQLRAEAGNITDTGAAPLLLDAEFAGTQLSQETLDEIWKLENEQVFGIAVWNALVDTGASLPRSGDGTEGGLFHGWFEAFFGER